jgi:hypothetical protein
MTFLLFYFDVEFIMQLSQYFNININWIFQQKQQQQ